MGGRAQHPVRNGVFEGMRIISGTRSIICVCCSALAAMAALSSCELLPSFPDDDQLISQYNNYRGDLDRLVAMSNEDSRADREDREHWEDYKQLLNKTGIADGMRREKDGSIFFTAIADDFEDGFAYLQNLGPHMVLRPRLDDRFTGDYFTSHPYQRDAILLGSLGNHRYLYVSRH